MKRIVICCDGTWNTPDERKYGVPTPTNVVRLHHTLATADAQGSAQLTYYHPGVGTNAAWWDKLAGGGAGLGLEFNIKSAYRYLCDHYADGDQIYLFGFSRGAYTVRSLAGFIAHSGLLDFTGVSAETEIWQRIEQVFQNGYRRRLEGPAVWSGLGWHFHRPPSGRAAIPLRFIGVWDTVGALGIPHDMAVLSLLDNFHDFTFHDTTLGANVQTARHAIAIDEQRASFQPTLWNEAPDSRRDVRETWFPGVHSDIGGGYRETGLSDGALLWMIEEAEATGLAFLPAVKAQIHPDPLGVLHDSCAGVFKLLPTQPRSTPPILPGTPNVHASALTRVATPPITQGTYRPTRSLTPGTPMTLPIYAANPWNDTGVWLEAGHTYSFTAKGEWLDSTIKSAPDGTHDGKFHLGELAQIAGNFIGWAEGIYKKITGNQDANFKGTKRQEEMQWFCLVGAIANSIGVDAKCHILPPETFRIGKGANYTPRKSGYLYAYANDAWNFYGNNRGSVKLTIS